MDLAPSPKPDKQWTPVRDCGVKEGAHDDLERQGDPLQFREASLATLGEALTQHQLCSYVRGAQASSVAL